MKALLIYATALFTSLSAMASDSVFLISAEKDKVMVIDLKSTLGRDVKVTIVDLKNDIVFGEQFKAKAPERRYNLSKLNTGTFTVIVEEENKISYQRVYLSKNSLLIDNDIDEIVKPAILTKDNLWCLKGVNTKYTGNVAIIDTDGNRIFNDQIKTGDNEKVYNVSKLRAGEYTMMYTVNGKSFRYNLNKK